MSHNPIKPSTSREFLLADMEIPVPISFEPDTFDQLTGQFQEKSKQYQTRSSIQTRLDDTNQVILAVGLNQTPQNDMTTPFSDVARCIGRLAAEYNGFWTFDPSALFLLILPKTIPVDAKAVAQACQQQITLIAKQIVTLGIAFSPSPENQPLDALANAKKAARHASFLGPGASALFDAVSLNISGDDFFRQGEIEPAIVEFEAGLRLDAQNANLLNSLGVCHAISGNYPKAREVFQKVAALDPDEVMAIYNLGLVLLLTGEEDQALAHFQAAESIDDSIFEIHFQMARIYQTQNQPDQAIASLNRAVDIKPDAAAAHRMLGDEMVRQKNYLAAKKNFAQALRHRPNDAKALSALGTLYGNLNENLDLAELYLTQSVTIDPDDGDLFLALGIFYKKNRQMEKATQAFQKAYRLGVEKGGREADQIRSLGLENDETLQTAVS